LIFFQYFFFVLYENLVALEPLCQAVVDD